MSLELTWLRKIDFFPGRPSSWSDALSKQKTLCIGTKSRNLGDALVLTTLPRKLREKFPGIQVTTYPRAFNPWVFRGNPHVNGVSRLPRAVYGDDANWGKGQLIQLKEAFFDLDSSSPPKPELHLLPSERQWGERWIKEHTLSSNKEKPLCILHPWGSTRGNVAPVEFWDELVRRWSPRVRFWQVGLEGQGAIQGCEYYHLLPKTWSSVRKLFPILAQADLFLGVDSGPMHAARAFDLPGLIFLNHADPALAFENRAQAPYFLRKNWQTSFLYEENRHLTPSLITAEQTLRETDRFFESSISGN